MHLYLHIPFCARRCSYCDFAIAVRKVVPSDAYSKAVLREWDSWQDHEIWSSSRSIETIYLGGGTPSLLDIAAVGGILAGIRKRRPVFPNAEVTIEVNPDDVTYSRAREWLSLGINRISMGVQSFDPAVLTWMHRTHSADAPATAMHALRDAGFGNISLDLIFALPAQLTRDWSRDLDLALKLEPEHLSLYGLTVEQHTPLGRWVARGETIGAEDDRYAEEFLVADRAMRSAGMVHYEVSNAGKPGFRSRHNSAYWRRRPFIGLGPSAHSGWNQHRRWNVREWAAYAGAIEAGLSVLAGEESLSAEAVRLEDLYLGLRTMEGVSESWIPASVREQWIGQGWATRSGSALTLSPEGWLRLDALVASLTLTASPSVAEA
jgi:oxygen-independent coproporphyrinogen-3 oxidase